MVKQHLQTLTNNNSNSLIELYEIFLKEFPNEFGIHNLLRDYVFSETPMETSELENALKTLKGKA